MGMIYILFILGFILLIKGADYLVTGSSDLARKMGIPKIVVGMVIAGFGTSSPELVVNVISALRGDTEIALGNVIGSSISNILFVLGTILIFCPIVIRSSMLWKEIPFSLLGITILLVAGSGETRLISKPEGILMLFVFALFIYYMIDITIKGRDLVLEEESRSIGNGIHSNQAIAVMILGGLAGLSLGGYWIVNGTIQIAKNFGVSEFLIAATILAIGTSLPELAASIVAIIKKEPDIFVGNIVGSNIFNILLITGITALIKPIDMIKTVDFDLFYLIFATIILFLSAFRKDNRHRLTRVNGIIFVFLYAVYLYIIIRRG